tara:strand:- start:785 stop:1087 length:303 start_codon:yes stop_codon:yes gene_type:complete
MTTPRKPYTMPSEKQRHYQLKLFIADVNRSLIVIEDGTGGLIIYPTQSRIFTPHDLPLLEQLGAVIGRDPRNRVCALMSDERIGAADDHLEVQNGRVMWT